jgi:2-iminobutanoate/2-iminopropanoate deaminase
MKLRRINCPTLDEPVGPYVHAVQHGDTLYLSGFTAFGTAAQTETIEKQAEEIFRQVQAVAMAEGSSLENIVKITAFVTELDRLEALRKALFDIYGQNLPASSLILVSGLFAEDLKIEIEAIIAV